jgi:hypothetical protein
VDLAWYLSANDRMLPVTKDEAVASYRDNLAWRLGTLFDEAWWRPQCELSLLTGFLQLGWGQALSVTDPDESEAVRTFARAELDWWSRHIRNATRWL